MAEREEEDEVVDPQQKSSYNKKQIDEILSEEGKFAYVRLCSIQLCSLYPAKHERLGDSVHYTSNFLIFQTNLVGLLLYDLEKEIEDNNDNPLNKTLLIKELKRECGQHQKLVSIPKNLILFALESEQYDARHRVLIYSVAGQLGVSPDSVADIEDEFVSHLKACKDKEKSDEGEKRKEDESSRKFQRGVLIGLGAIGGGVLLGQRLNRRLGDIEQFEFEKLTQGDHLNVVIAVSGWLKEDEGNAFKQCGFQEPWKKMILGREQYCLKWESKYITELGSAISSFLTSTALTMTAEQVIKHTVIQGLVSAISWPLALLQVGYIIDNPWSVCATRSVEVGKHLAHVLMERDHGNRPVTLVGFSFGARVIFHCLKTLSSMKGNYCSEGIVQEAIMIGAPVTGDPREWQGLEKVVAGRVVNGYCKKDWLLQFVYRTASVQAKVAGLTPVLWRNRRMFNVNLSHVVSE
ncbi:hypothetical protein QZH41_008295 [Actinostola sp. cb2023]|nr:hypothetical protein QZH41_008295 [Actinostola sp. cb2023]